MRTIVLRTFAKVGVRNGVKLNLKIMEMTVIMVCIAQNADANKKVK